MKKLHFKLTTEQLMGISAFLETELPEALVTARTNAQKSVVATLIAWHLAKIKSKTYITQPGKHIGLKLDAPVAFALLCFLEEYVLDPSNYIENTLLSLSAKLDQAYAMSILTPQHTLPTPSI